MVMWDNTWPLVSLMFPLGQNMGYGPALIQEQIPMVQSDVLNHVMHMAPIRHIQPVAPDVAHVSTAHAERPEKFNGSNFKFLATEDVVLSNHDEPVSFF